MEKKKINNPMQWLIQVVRVLGIGICIYGSINEKKDKKFLYLRKKTRRYKLMYLTNLGLLVTVIALALGLIVSLLEHKKNKNRYSRYILKVSDLFSYLANGLEFIITISFWILYTVSPTLVVDPREYNAGYRYPIFKQISMHGLPLIFTLIEVVAVKTGTGYHNLLFICAFTIVYYSVIQIAPHYGIDAPYALLRRSGEFTKLLIFLGAGLLGGVLNYLYIKYISRKINRNNNQSVGYNSFTPKECAIVQLIQ